MLSSILFGVSTVSVTAVSYTHLDVYKRQGITNERVRRLTTLLSQGKSPADMHGKNKSGNAKPGFIIDNIKQHISSFPAKVGHYTNKEYYYLSERLNLLEMHKLFVQKYPDLNVNYNFYRKVFVEHFSLTFGRP